MTRRAPGQWFDPGPPYLIGAAVFIVGIGEKTRLLKPRFALWTDELDEPQP